MISLEQANTAQQKSVIPTHNMTLLRAPGAAADIEEIAVVADITPIFYSFAIIIFYLKTISFYFMLHSRER